MPILSPGLPLKTPETTLQKLADIGQFTAGVMSVLILVSIWLLWAQLRQQAEDSRTQLITGMTGLIISVSRVFIEYPDMRKYFHNGAAIAAGSAGYERASAIAVTMADAMDHVAEHLDRMDHAAQEAWKAYVSDIYNSSPIFRDYLARHKHWYGPALHKQLRLDHGAEEPPS